MVVFQSSKNSRLSLAKSVYSYFQAHYLFIRRQFKHDRISIFRRFFFFLSGTIRNLSPQIWELCHLTSLYLNDNNLTRIPPEISKLEHLVYLDLSANKLRSLPAELGDMHCLRELLLQNNQLRVLPYELGRLFQLQSLGMSVGLLG